MKIAVFPGQGSQHVGMGKSFYENFGYVRELFEEASEACKIDFKRLCFDGPESDLTLTANTQPCLLTVSVAAFRVAEKEFGFRPDAGAGHSLGEYSALVSTGTVSFASAVRWVRERGLAMQAAVPPGEGTMAAILNLDDALITQLCEKATAAAKLQRQSSSQTYSIAACAEPANFNSPGQVVIAGSVDAIQCALDLLKSDAAFKGAKGIPLSVSAPFHSSLMAPARDRMAEIFANTVSTERPKALEFSYVPNRTARLTREPGVVFELLVEQVDHPVLWKQSVEALLQSGAHTFIEFGPGKVLQGLCKRIATPLGHTPKLLGLSDLSNLKSIEELCV